MTDGPDGPTPEEGGRPEEAGPAGRDEGATLASAGPGAPTATQGDESPRAPDPPWPRGRTTPGIDLPGPRSVRDAWRRAGAPGRVGLAVASIAALVLLGAFLFGLWHVLFGGFVRGNWRAGGFGIALASACGVLLWIDAIVLRRLGARG